jgi:hypothetical protein
VADGLDQPAAPERPRDESARRARSVRRDEGVDAFQALQRVLYRSAKQDPGRRFHALYDKLTRRDVMWGAWVDVATNQGAPGVDGVRVASIEDGGVEGEGLSSTVSPTSYGPGPTGPVRCGGSTSPSPVSRARPDRFRSRGCGTGW